MRCFWFYFRFYSFCSHLGSRFSLCPRQFVKLHSVCSLSKCSLGFSCFCFESLLYWVSRFVVTANTDCGVFFVCFFFFLLPTLVAGILRDLLWKSYMETEIGTGTVSVEKICLITRSCFRSWCFMVLSWNPFMFWTPYFAVDQMRKQSKSTCLWTVISAR